MHLDLSMYDDQNVAVVGLGKSGLATARALIASGATIACWDDSEKAREKAQDVGLPLTPPDRMDPSLVVLSPGVPLTHPAPHPIVTKAKHTGAPVIGDIELLYRACPSATYVGVTGTNGKSTTTALIGHILRQAGRRAEIGGNLGVPALALESLGSDGIYVLEMSSYQLELLRSTVFNVGVLLNLTPDHLDRHGDMENYLAAKEHIFDRQGPDEAAVISLDDDYCEKAFVRLSAMGRRILPISVKRPVQGGVYVRDDSLFESIDGSPFWALRMSSAPKLPGKHNAQNIAAAFAACRALGLDAGETCAGIRSFPGLAHRQEIFAELGGLKFVNDSKATNAEAAARALASFERIYWIAGGREKEGGYAPLLPHIGHVRRAFLIGEAAATLSAFLRGKCDTEQCGDLKTAVFKALTLAMDEGAQDAAILLSPACASFDQFASFEARGDAFKAVVTNVLRTAAPGKDG